MAGRTTTVSRPPKWPKSPYKGLTFYGEEDVPLFAGRDGDIDSVCESIGLGNIRILLLHGLTGCGKSSFLRAGLIPALEEEIAGYEFLRDENGKPDFVRSTDDPVASLARRVYRFVYRSDLGAPHSGDSGLNFGFGRRLNKSLAIPIYAKTTEESFLRAVARDPQKLVSFIELITSQIPRTFVLVIDQAEELITVQPDKDGEPARIQFFDFLADISRSRFDLKLIICFRTEYHGQFYAKLRYGADVSRISDYYLSDLNEKQIVEAILRPTAKENIPGYGAPLDFYNFEYEEGLPKSIATALLSSGITGGVLPALQLVCRRLYEGVQPGPPGEIPDDEPAQTSSIMTDSPLIRRITTSAFTTLGGIAGQVISYLQDELNSAMLQPFAAGMMRSDHRIEIDKWRGILTALVKTQINGTTTTDIIPEEVLRKRAKEFGCQIEPQAMFTFLTNERRRLLRVVDVTRLNTKDVIHCYSLGHDVLANALVEWNEREQQKRSDRGVTFRHSESNSNIHGKAYALNIITPMKPWKSLILRRMFWLLKHVRPLTEDIRRLSFITFARWHIVGHKDFPHLSGDNQRESLSYDYLILACSVNVTWNQYIDSLSAVLSHGFDLFYRWSENFPGARWVTPLTQYLTNVQFKTDYYYTAYPLATIRDINSAHRVADAFEDFEEQSADMSDEAFETAYREFVISVQKDLGATGIEALGEEVQL